LIINNTNFLFFKYFGVVDKRKEITLTENGKNFYLLNNPVFGGKLDQSLSKEESMFLTTKCILQRPLQLKINKKITKLVSETEHGKSPDMTDDLDKICVGSIEEFFKENPDEPNKIRIENDIIAKSERMNPENERIRKHLKDNKDTLDSKEKIKLRKQLKQTPIEAMRSAVMGRLTELGVVEWEINSNSRSEYKIANKELADSLMNIKIN